MRAKFILLVGVLGCSSPSAWLLAQTCDQAVRGDVKAVQDARAKVNAGNAGAQAELNNAEQVLSNDLDWNDTGCLVGLILRAKSSVPQQIVGRVKAAFQQNGSDAGTQGGTNLVSKGTTAEILSLAAEHGALAESTSGSTVTLQGSIGGLPTLLVSQGVAQGCSAATPPPGCISNRLVNFMNRFSYSVGFDTSQSSQTLSGTATSAGSAQAAIFTATSHTLNSVTLKGTAIPAPPASTSGISAAIAKLDKTSKLVATDTNVQKAQHTLKTDCPANPDPQPNILKTWMAEAREELLNQNVDDEIAFAAAWYGLAPSLVRGLEADPTCKKRYLGDSQVLANDLGAYLASLNAFFEGLRGAPVLSFEYDYNSPANQPTNSVIRGIFQYSKGGWTATVNAAGSFYNSQPSSAIPGASQVRDFQVAGEGAYDFSKGKNLWLGNSTASLAYYYQDQTSPAILNVTPGQPVTGVTFTGLSPTATQVFAQKGVINVAQFKFTFIPAKTNINLPVSVTWSNRTELVTNSVWRAQLGISYDFDSLFSRSK